MDIQAGQDFVLVDDDDLHGYDEELPPQSPEVLSKILQWLSPTDYLGEGSEYNKHLSSYVAGTDLWIQQTEAYHQWHDSPDHGALWTKAIAGAGKSVFAAMLAAQLVRTEKVPVLFFFFRQIIATNHDPHSMVRDWIAMVLIQSPSLQARMKKHIDDDRALENISTNEFWRDLVPALASLPKVYCIVDALDEMDINQEDFLKSLVALGKRKPSTIKLLMTSRPLPRIETFLKASSILQIRLEQLKVDKDITVYIDYRLRKHEDLEAEVYAAITHAIGTKSQGSFLYARLMMDEVLDHLTNIIPKVEFIQKSMDWLPVTLEGMYNGMLLDHSLRSQVPQELQLTILQWVTHSTRPLRLLELAAMLDSQSKTGRVARDTKAVVRAACGPLLEILEDETVSVIHHSFTEFLIDAERMTRDTSESSHPQFPVIDPVKAHNAMALACLKYLTSGCLDDWNIKEWPSNEYPKDRLYRFRPSQEAIRMRHPFLEYAMSNFCVHGSKLDSFGTPLLEALDAFMLGGDRAFSCWRDMSWIDTVELFKLSPVHIASWAGMTSYVQHLLGMGLECNGLDGRKRTPLSWASARGNSDVVALLLEHVPDPDVPDDAGHKPLHYAVLANHHEIVALLLAAGVSPINEKTEESPESGCMFSTTGYSPLRYCCTAGSIETLREMMPYLKPEDLRQALSWAVSSGQAEAVELLLASPGTVIDRPDYFDKLLYLAACGHHVVIMQSLLDRGAVPSSLGRTPLHAVCSSHLSNGESMQKCINLLLEAGCDINAVDDAKRTALHYLVDPRQYSDTKARCCQLLLENGADVMAQDYLGNTPLHLVYRTDIVDILMANGADMNKRNAKGQTPVDTILEAPSRIDIKCLLPYVPNWNIHDSSGDTPLHIIFSKSYHPAAALRDLVNAGADLGKRNKKGEAPIHVLKEISDHGRKDKNFFADLVRAGADLNVRDRDGRTVLLRLLAAGHAGYQNKSVGYALDCGAQIKVVDFEGNGPLHLACNQPQDDSLVKVLLEAGADPLCINHSGNTPLHVLLNSYPSSGTAKPDQMVAIVELLLSAGVPPGAQNNGGQTALHFACGNLPGESTLPRTEEPGLLEFVLNSEIGKSIDVEDYHGIRPIHLAATISEHLLAILIIKGANSTAVTYEGKSLLHIAARTRNPNAIGLLLEHFSAIDRNDLIDATDKNRRTALHEACRSGRPESVDLLLQAGADANAKDNEGLTPLHACAEFEEENLFWSPAASKLTPQRHMLASGVLDSDPLRPEPRDCYGQPYQRDEFKPISTDDDTVRIREIIRLLWTYGAQFIPQDPKDRTVLCPFNQAVTKRVADMVDELLPYMDNYEAQAYEAQAAEDDSHFFNTYVRKYNKALERHLLGRAQAAVFESDLYLEAETADNTHLLDTNTHLLETLLALGKYTAIEQLPAKGIDLLYKPDGGSDFLTTLVQRGYASLLESLAVMIPGHGWVNGKVDLGPYRVNGIAPYIMTAVATRLPNLGVLKALVEKFKADVNIQPEIKVQPSYRDVYVPGPRPLHILALGYHWWQAKGLEYLLNHGANTELKDHNSQTPLHAAVSKGNGSHRQMEAIKILLKHGANPNTIDDEGNTCLNSSMHNIEIVRLLLSAGADLTFGVKSALFPAIASQDVAVVTALLKTGADCNVRSKPLDGKQNLPDQVPTRIPQHEYYPIHYAADAQFNTPNTRETAIQIINLLLDNGADPFLNFRPDESIIHDIFEHGGVLQPFLDLPRLDLERRDPRGRTLLLAASRSGIGTVLPTNSPFDGNRNVPWSDPAKLKAKFGIGDTLPALIVYEKGGDLMAVDNEGNNVLHFLSVAPIHNIDEYQKACSLFIEKAPSLIHQKNARGWKPFHYAIKHQRMWLVEALLNAGADPLGKDPNGDTAIHHLATSISELEWFRKFLELGVPINAKNNEGETALFGVYQKQIYKREELEKRHARFEEAGADIFARNNEGKSLLHIVAPKRWDTGVDTFKFLIEKGLDPMVEDNSQRTSLDVAVASSNTKVLALFQRGNGIAKSG